MHSPLLRREQPHEPELGKAIENARLRFSLGIPARRVRTQLPTRQITSEISDLELFVGE